MPLAAPAPKRAGVHPLLAAQAAAAERLPVLRALLDKTAARLCEPSRLVAGQEAGVALARVEARPMGDVLANLPPGAVAGQFRLSGWNTSLLIALAPDLVAALVEAAFGGGGGEASSQEGRALSRADLALARAALDRIAQALQAALSEVKPATLVLERLETRLDRLDLGSPRQRTVAATLEIGVLGRLGTAHAILPAEILTALQQAAAGQDRPAVADPAWQGRFGGELRKTDVTVRAVLKDDGFTLADIAGLKVGRMLRLQASFASPILVEAETQALFRGTLGQADGRYTVRIDACLADEARSPDPDGPAARGAPRPNQRKPAMLASTSEAFRDEPGGTAPASDAGPDLGLDLGPVLGIPVTVDVVLGSTTLLVADLMKLGRGAILPLDGSVGDQVTIAVNGRVVARGEIVVLEEEEFRLGVSLTEVAGSAALVRASAAGR